MRSQQQQQQQRVSGAQRQQGTHLHRGSLRVCSLRVCAAAEAAAPVANPTSSTAVPLMLRALRGEAVERPPVWMMVGRRACLHRRLAVQCGSPDPDHPNPPFLRPPRRAQRQAGRYMKVRARIASLRCLALMHACRCSCAHGAFTRAGSAANEASAHAAAEMRAITHLALAAPVHERALAARAGSVLGHGSSSSMHAGCIYVCVRAGARACTPSHVHTRSPLAGPHLAWPGRRYTRSW